MAGQKGNGAAFDAVQPRDRAIARRRFLGLGGAAALSLLLAPRLAWGGVGVAAGGAPERLRTPDPISATTGAGGIPATARCGSR